jgi:hypothetical protein
MTVSVLFLLARLLVAVPLVVVGVDRVLDGDSPPVPRAWSALGLVGATGLVVGVWGDAAALVAAVAVLGGGVDESRRSGTIDEARARLVGLLGGALCVAVLYVAVGDAIDLTVTAPVLDLDLR